MKLVLHVIYVSGVQLFCFFGQFESDILASLLLLSIVFMRCE